MSDDEFENSPTETDNSLEAVRDLIRIEDARIARDNRQADIQDKALQVLNEQDQRQAQFHSQRIKLEDEADRRRVHLVRQVVACLAILLSASLALFFYMVFFGDESQRGNALEIIRTGGIGLAGFGVIQAVARATRSILRRRRNS